MSGTHHHAYQSVFICVPLSEILALLRPPANRRLQQIVRTDQIKRLIGRFQDVYRAF
jgi:hypothetical protein